MLELHTSIDDADLRRSNMTLLDGSDRRAVVAFAGDPSLSEFIDRLGQYRGEVPEGQKSPKFQAFFDAVVGIRPYGAEDRISAALARQVGEIAEPQELRLDVSCWHPGDLQLAEQWLGDCRATAVGLGGMVTTTYSNHTLGLLIARVYLPSDRLADFAQLDVVASIDLLPMPDITRGDLHSLERDQLPEVLPPAAKAPILGLIDSGVASAHPLLAGAVLAAESLSPHIADGEDRNGHGTMVASLALHGHIPTALRQRSLVPIAKVVSVAVLDSGNHFPDDSLWEQDLEEAIAYCASQGARVINLSIGDPSRPFVPPRQPAIASIVDHLAGIHNLVIVVSVGNADPRHYLSPSADEPTRAYVADLLNHPETGILPPGTAALALTVGGISTAGAAGAFIGREPAERRPFGEPGWPSSATRRGRGVERSIKPELVAASGTHGYEPARGVVDDGETGVVGASNLQGGRLLATRVGTSFSAPLVSRVALGVLARFPEFSANLVRAVTLLAAAPSWDGAELVGADGPLSSGRRAKKARSLIGYGETTLDAALDINHHRAVLVAEGKILMNAVHVYEVPIPSSFLESGGSRFMEVAVTHDPPVRSQRLDYLGNKLEFHVVKDADLNQLLAAFSKLEPGEPVDDGEGAVEGEVGDDGESDGGTESSTSSLRAAFGSRLIEFDVPTTERSRSANQLGRKTFAQRLPDASGATYLVVRSINRWCDSSFEQPYAVAVSLRRDASRADIYLELESQLEAVVEVELEADVVLEVE